MNIKITDMINKLLSGIQITLVSDAGTPSVSDPGFLLVRECMKHNIDTECLPGPTAFYRHCCLVFLVIDLFLRGFA